MEYPIKVEILRRPEKQDWERCKMFALNTIGKKYTGKEITDEWKRRILKSGHSPIRTLMFTIRLEIPYCYSAHFSRHKIGIEHYVSTQRNDRQDKYDRNKAPQDTMVVHMIDVNAAELIEMSHVRLCKQADETTRKIMIAIKNEVLKVNPEFGELLVPTCVYRNGCPEFYPCGYYMKRLGFSKNF